MVKFRCSAPLAICAVLVLPLWSPAQAPTVAEIVQQVTQGSYTSFLNNSLYTHLGDNRGFGAQHDQARSNIYSSFISYGLQTTLSPFQYNGTTYYNVIGILPGTTAPNEYLMIGAHYDSVNNPGADDNASGVAGVLSAAQAMTQYTYGRTLVFAAFDREEQGLLGSTAWANAHASWDIKGMVSLDMIAYNPAGANHDRAIIYGRTTSGPLKNALASSVQTYGGIASTIGGQLDQSDHAPFEAKGFQAALLIEGAVWSNPYYHKPTDSVDTLGFIDYDYATRMTKGTVGWMADAAIPVGRLDPDPVPEFSTMVAFLPGSGWLVLAAVRRVRTGARSRSAR
jgi:hypothetical protein